MDWQRQKIQRCMLSATKQAIRVKLATTVGHYLRDRDCDFANVYMALAYISWLVCFAVVFVKEQEGGG